jgi:hypothetical protein
LIGLLRKLRQLIMGFAFCLEFGQLQSRYHIGRILTIFSLFLTWCLLFWRFSHLFNLACKIRLILGFKILEFLDFKILEFEDLFWLTDLHSLFFLVFFRIQVNHWWYSQGDELMCYKKDFLLKFAIDKTDVIFFLL